MHQENLVQAPESLENDSTNVITPKWYHPTTYLDWMAQGFKSSAAAKSYLNGHVVACTWDVLSSSQPQFSPSQIHHYTWATASINRIKSSFWKRRLVTADFAYETGSRKCCTGARCKETSVGKSPGLSDFCRDKPLDQKTSQVSALLHCHRTQALPSTARSDHPCQPPTVICLLLCSAVPEAHFGIQHYLLLGNECYR